MGIFNVATVCSAIIVVYLAVGTYQLYKLMNPLEGVEISGVLVAPLWPEGQKFDMFAFLSTKSQLAKLDPAAFKDSSNVIFERRGLAHSKLMELQELSHEVHLNHTQSKLLRDVAKEVHSNRSSVFFHVVLVRHGHEHLPLRSILSNRAVMAEALHGTVRLIKYDRIPKSFHYKYLLSDFNLVQLTADEKQKLAMPLTTVISYWKPEVAIKLISDFNTYPVDYVPQAVATNAVRSSDNELFYKPSLHVDEIGLTSDKYIHLNSSVQQLPLKISFGPMSSQRWMLMSQLEVSLGAQKGLGFSEKDIDDVRRLITDTSVNLLAATIAASVLHLVFEILAFQSDISFWKTQSKHVGISLRTVIISLLSQIIVFLFLLINDTSMLIIVPAFIGILIQIWKARKACGLSVKFKYSCIPVICFDQLPSQSAPSSADTVSADGGVISAAGENNDAMAKLEAIGQEADAFAYKYMGMLLVPVVCGFIIYSLIYDKHYTWYTFIITSLTGCVYTFGFILMFPQLYINHKLQSVSHLPWKFLVYKFINTFIDDLFAFVIKMPTMHRLSVFRDDFVFLIYLYQRYTYKVDTSRPAEK